jgi:Motility quorum-sensing regulator, toxin of MqsA
MYGSMMIPSPTDGDSSRPAHDLTLVKAKVRSGAVWYRRAARDGAGELELSPEDINATVLALTPADFHKSMPATQPVWEGCFQDVYRPTVNRIVVYLEFQFWPPERVYIVSFNRK